jgi:excinuclease ABC subunit C
VPLLVFKLPKKEVMKSSELGKDVIKRELPLIPKSPGVYRMLDHKDVILYVGKAKNLPNRLKSYVAEKNHIIRTERMLSQTFKLEITTTANESEALLLEANLIKKHKPKFNILLKDDKSFPFVFISNKDQWAQVTKHRGKKDKEGFYFGPFASAGTANWTIKMLQKIFQIRVCDDSTFKNRKRPCILYQIKRCSGPCVDYIDKEDYKKSVDQAIQFVSGKSRDIQKNLSKQMEEASEKLDFEKASIFRDRIKSLNIIQSSQRINEANLIDADVIAAYKESGKTCIQVFFYRSKQNWGNQAYFPKHDPDQDVSEIMSSFLMQFYENKNVPKLIIINTEIKDKKLIEETLSKKESITISINVAKKGTKAKVIAMAEKNAKESLNRKIYETNNNKNLFDGVAKKFHLKNGLNLVEVYDNSHISGTNSVGAMITFGNEGFVKKRYRKFDIKTKNAEQDDFAMLKEVLTRRFKRAMLEKGNYLTLPDLILIDGGKGQYSSAKEVLDEFGLYDLPMIAIAKGKLRNSGDETFFYKGKSFKFNKNDPTLFFMQRLRDEAHRFAITSHRAKRAKGITKSLLDQIDGIGSIRKRALLNHFGSARAVESASFDEIKSVEGVEEKVAKKIYNFFHE